ncbi:MAG: porin family protein [Rhodobacteraceae bacterium]|nr:porin family protein [Paracoccaceae bacterium]
MKMLKTAVASAVAVSSLAGAAAAQGWTGAYVGGAYGVSRGDYAVNPAEGHFDGSNGQLFAGYNYQFGGLTVGGELATFLGDVSVSPSIYSHRLDNLTDLKLRFGTTFGSALVYALAGYSFGTSNSGGADFDFHGVNYGIGVDYAVSGNFFLGAELLARNIKDDSGQNYLDTRPMTTASIRAGFRF